jgi:probable rRNA maturation factor
MITINYSNQTQTELETKSFFEVIEAVLPKHGITDNVIVELRIVGREAMQALNNAHRHKDYPTDVLSFPIWPDLDTIRKQGGQVLLGSIVVCLPVAQADAHAERVTLSEKINFLIEHSLLHLMGFHHEGDE